jgi:hypothetical protein
LRRYDVDWAGFSDVIYDGSHGTACRTRLLSRLVLSKGSGRQHNGGGRGN